MSSNLIAYRVHPGAGPERLAPTSRIQRGDELAFAYSNPESYQHLMVFAVDEHHHVYWYHPAWTDSAADPPAVPILPKATVTELSEAVAHPFDGRTLILYGLFTHDAPTERRIEALIAKQALPQDGVRLVRYSIGVE